MFRRITEAVTAKFREGLAKTRDAFRERVQGLFGSRSRIDESLFEELEETLIAADVGVHTALRLVEELRAEAKRRNLSQPSELRPILEERLLARLRAGEGRAELRFSADGLTVFLFVGVNGVGKTTTIGKLACRLTSEGRRVLLAAGDTYRAAAIEQLEIWGRRAGCDVVRHQPGADPAAVMFDALQAARHRGIDVLLCDTAGRLQNKANLMEELEKIYRVLRREVPDGPHEVLLVVDATTGQNALEQARRFGEKTGVTGIVLTKLDGTAKGGIAVAIQDELGLPVKLVGIGEKPDDLEPFDAEAYVRGLFGDG